jgi:glycosyltransferase involved in cell wall biosynthesis
MKAAQVLMISGHYGHLDRRIIAEANSLAASGRAVTLVSVPTRIPDHCLQAGVRVVIGSQTGGDKTRGWLHSLARAAAVKVFGAFRPCIWARRQRALERYFLDLIPPADYTAIHCHDLDTLPAAQAVRHRLAPRAKLLYDSHELFPYQVIDQGYQRFWRRIEERYIHSADVVITVNESVASQMEKLYGITTPFIILNSCDNPWNQEPVTVAEFFRHFRATPGGFRVLFQGSLTPLRNLPNLVRAFALLDNSFRLFILGSGPLETQMRQICAGQGIRNVLFGGHIPQADLLRFTAHADLGMIPYLDGGILNMRYCTPNKLFEFIQVKVPVCASKLPELTRLVTENGIGAVYEMRSPQEVAAAIQDCRRRCERDEFDSSARERARKKFAWSEQSKRLIGLYESLGV